MRFKKRKPLNKDGTASEDNYLLELVNDRANKPKYVDSDGEEFFPNSSSDNSDSESQSSKNLTDTDSSPERIAKKAEKRSGVKTPSSASASFACPFQRQFHSLHIYCQIHQWNEIPLD